MNRDSIPGYPAGTHYIGSTDCKHEWVVKESAMDPRWPDYEFVHEACTKCTAWQRTPKSKVMSNDNTAFGYIPGPNARERGIVPVLIDIGAGKKMVEFHPKSKFTPEVAEAHYKAFDEWSANSTCTAVNSRQMKPIP